MQDRSAAVEDPPDRSVERDGRSARRARNREAVLDALIELIVADNLDPTVEQVAAKSGVSLRSVYRYFDDRDALVRAAVARAVDRIAPYFEVPDAGRGPLEDRIDRLVDARLALYEVASPISRVARLRAPSDPVIAEQLAVAREQLTEQLRVQFAPELTALSAAEVAGVLATMDAVFQIEGVENLVLRHRLGPDELRAALRTALRRLIPA